MNKITVDFTKEVGKIKPMHAVNNGPVKAPDLHGLGNFDAWVEAGIPYARNHDASFCGLYGGEHIVDVMSIFPNFDADVNDPASYDFQLTDEYLRTTLDAGTKIFYRLGHKIEHWSKKYGTLPPKDYQKWAEICEHIIMHYNEGWANGHHWDIEYWEIWNEPDISPEDAEHKPTWGGTKAEFFDFFEVGARHLKNRFPNLKIGGPATAGASDWLESFIIDMNKRKIHLDFVSWHLYGFDIKFLADRAEFVRNILDENGYENTESICNEWNYIRNWDTQYPYSIRQIIALKGAIFTGSRFLAGQNTCLDMLMYYDARPCIYNGMFDFYTYEPLKGYYVFRMFNELYKLGTACEIKIDCDDVYAVAAKNETDEAIMISFYTDNDDDNSEKTIELDLNGKDEYDIYLLDEEHDMDKVGVLKKGDSLKLKHNTAVLLK